MSYSHGPTRWPSMGFAMLNPSYEDFLPRAAGGYAHQRFEAVRRVEQHAARAAENDRPAVGGDRVFGEFQGEPGVLLDPQQSQVIFPPDAREARPERVDGPRRKARGSKHWRPARRVAPAWLVACLILDARQRPLPPPLRQRPR